MTKKSSKKIQVGHRYGDWVLIAEAERIGGDMRYLCQCACGTEKRVSAITLRNGSSKNCGCNREEKPARSMSHDLQPTPPDIQEIFHLISEGCLPPADQFSFNNGAPSWTFPAIAKILGIDRKELVHHLGQAGPRFASERASRPNDAPKIHASII